MEKGRDASGEVGIGEPGAREWNRLLECGPEEARLLAERLYVGLDDPQKQRLLETLLLLLWRVYRDEPWRRKRFEAAQAIGLHVLPVHFYSPVPDTTKLSDSLWQRREAAGIDWREGEQLELLDRLLRWSDEMREWPIAKSPDGKAFHLGNGAFDYTDAAVLYALLRELRPRRIIEVGCGWSSLVISAACGRQETELIQIEPYPPELLADNPRLKASRAFERPVQAVPAEVFDELVGGDILFIDSTHVSKIGSDVNDLMFRVIPRLAPGVLIHFHDILLPREYPEAWVKERRYFWNEQYLVQALLMFNREFEVVLSNAYLFDRHRERLERAFPFLPRQNGGSLWIRRGGS